jgi:ankyrin repeat protein
VGLVSGPSETSILFEACKTGHETTARGLIEANAGLANAREAGGIIPLHVAATEGHAEVVSLLLENGAEVQRTTTT